MDANEILSMYELVINDCLTRLRKRNRRVDARDVHTIFEPVLLQIARVSGNQVQQRTLVHNRLSDWMPEQVTEASLKTFIGRLVEAGAPPIDWADMRAKQRELERELSAV